MPMQEAEIAAEIKDRLGEIDTEMTELQRASKALDPNRRGPGRPRKEPEPEPSEADAKREELAKAGTGGVVAEPVKADAPGSPDAQARGCTCPVLDNQHGYGTWVDDDGKRQYTINGACPLHGAGV